MTGSDLIVLAPWAVFALCIAVVYARLLRARRSVQQPPPSAWPAPGGSSRLHRIFTRCRRHLHSRRRA